MTEPNHYATLGVAPTATSEEIKRAWRRLARQYHPDVSKAPDAEERFKAINVAYQVLGSTVERSNYDFCRRQPPPHSPRPETRQASHTRRRKRASDTTADYMRADFSTGTPDRRGFSVNGITHGWFLALLILFYVVPIFIDYYRHGRPFPPQEIPFQASVEPKGIEIEIVGGQTSDGIQPSSARPMCQTSFKPSIVRLGERSRYCSAYTGPVEYSERYGTGTLASLGKRTRTAAQSRQSGDEAEFVAGSTLCFWVIATQTGIGTVVERYRGPKGKAECVATVQVTPNPGPLVASTP